MKGKLHLAHGPMFSGKTTWLVSAYGDGRGVLAFKPRIDTRYTKKAVLKTHDGGEAIALLTDVGVPESILERVDMLGKEKKIVKVLIDETNFFDEALLPVIDRLIMGGVSVCAAGLLLDSDRNDFGVTRKLVERAHEVIELTARCDWVGCGVAATLTYAKRPKRTQLVVGAGDLYGAVCAKHYPDLSLQSVGK